MAASPTEVDVTSYRWSSADEQDRFPVENPATGKVITVVQGGGAAEVNAAVDAAHKAFEKDWRWRAPAERARFLAQCADLAEAHADELSELVCQENGKPILDARSFDVATLIGELRFYAGVVDRLPDELYDQGNLYVKVVHEPLGVIGGIIPFNWPPIHTVGKIAPAIAVGNTVVLKPSEQAPLTTMRIVELLSSVLPPDVVHAVPGLGPTTGQALVAHPLVKKVSFTGSFKAGAAVAKTAAEDTKQALLELGGKNPLIIFDDADIDRVVRDALEGGFFNKGEACTAASRVLVQRGIHDIFMERLSAGVRALKTGNGADPATHVGPCVTKMQQQRVLDYIRIGVEEGATIVAEGTLPDDPELANGFYVAPTLFDGVTRTMRIAQEEIFGPVVVVLTFDTEEEALAVANESEYGLMSSVYTGDGERLFRVARGIEAGMVLANNYFRGAVGVPFGGIKHSGYGREHAIETLREFTYAKLIRYPSGTGHVPSWRAVNDIFGATGSTVSS
jgi:acyl-CoA reductase-like NAD-dependent aldehyde dehydrogenase